MLVLSRKVGERIAIAGDIVVQVLEIRGRQVRLGIDAPHDVPIRREELERREVTLLPEVDDVALLTV